MKAYKLYGAEKISHRTLHVHSASYTRCIDVGSYKLKLPKTFMPIKYPPPPPQVLAYDIKSDTLAIHFSLVHNITDQDKDSWSRFHDLLNIGF